MSTFGCYHLSGSLSTSLPNLINIFHRKKNDQNGFYRQIEWGYFQLNIQYNGKILQVPGYGDECLFEIVYPCLPRYTFIKSNDKLIDSFSFGYIHQNQSLTIYNHEIVNDEKFCILQNLLNQERDFCWKLMQSSKLYTYINKGCFTFRDWDILTSWIPLIANTSKTFVQNIEKCLGNWDNNKTIDVSHTFGQAIRILEEEKWQDADEKCIDH